MNINKDNSNNKGWGKVDKNKEVALVGIKTHKVAGDNLGTKHGIIVERHMLSQAIKKGWGKALIIPKTFHIGYKEEKKKSTRYPHVIHIPCGERQDR